MDNSWYSFDVHFGWVALALLGGLLLAFLLYSKKNVPWSTNASLMLGGLRMMSLFLIAILLLNPLLRLSINSTEKPIVVVALDNSESIQLRSPKDEISNIKIWLKQVADELSGDFQMDYTDMTASDFDTILFDSKSTNLSGLLQEVNVVHEGENLAAIVLASDGIINEGSLPQYRTWKFPIFTLGLGDTIAPKDLLIREVRANKIGYQGNQFPVRVELRQKGFDNQETSVTIRGGNKILAEQKVVLSGPISVFNFNIPAEEAGLKHLIVQVSPLSEESSYVNNKQDIYINIIEGKERVLIVAPAPHPDISAIRKVLSRATNYETELYIAGVTKEEPKGKYDVLIEHNAFSGVTYPKVEVNGFWYILGSKSLPRVNKGLSYLNIQQRGGQTDLVNPILVKDFSKFQLNADYRSIISEYPPLNVPFGDYKLSGPVQVLLNQRVGSLDTGKPLMLYYDDGNLKNAVTMASGIWQWRLQEAGIKDKSELFDEMVLKTVQFLSIKADKKQFVVRPRQMTFNENDRIFLDTEVYDEIYERSYGNTINLNITDESDKTTAYELVDSEVNSAFNLGRMNQGVYKYTATTNLQGKVLKEVGEFVVNETQLEGLDLQADHHVLRAISEKSGGDFYHFSDRNQLASRLKNTDFKSVIHTDEELFPLINSLWVIGLILLLLTTEWFFRKYLGAY